jgi:histidinol-phosphatase
MTTDEWREDLSLAQLLADEAARVAMSFVGRSLAARTKADGSIVTEADEAVEDTLRATLAVERSSDAILGEERGRSGSGERLWIIDGIDGTHRFAEGSPEWGCLVALQVAGETVVGVVEQPASDRRYWAVRGGGAFRRAAGRDSPVRVSEVSDLSVARGLPPGSEWCRDDRSHRVAAELAALVAVPFSDHPAMQVAWGGHEAAMLSECGPWDLATPALVVEEAGGRFSDLDGRHSIGSGAGLFTNGHVHAELLARLAVP